MMQETGQWLDLADMDMGVAKSVWYSNELFIAILEKN